MTHKQDLVLENRKMSSSVSVQPVSNDAAIVEISPSEEENVNEHLVKNIDKIYGPVLKMMKIFGTFFGETCLKRLTNASGCFKRRFCITRIYCGVVVSGFWLNFVISFVDVIVGNNIFLFLMFSFWCLLVALNGTVSLFVLCVPVAEATKSRFEIFISNLLAITSNVDLEKVKSKSRKGIIIFCVFIVCAAAGIIATYVTLDFTIAAFYPWNTWFGFRTISLIFFIYGEGAWLLPVLFLCITCLILEELFDDLHKQMSPSHSASANIEALMVEHRKLCELVELADKVLAPLLFGMVSVFIPLICFNFYKTVNVPEEDTTMFLATNLFWLLTSAGLLATIMLFGSRVSEKVHLYGMGKSWFCYYRIFFFLCYLCIFYFP